MTDQELAEARTEIGNMLMHVLLTPKNRRELEQRLRDVKAEIDRHAEVAELHTRYSP